VSHVRLICGGGGFEGAPAAPPRRLPTAPVDDECGVTADDAKYANSHVTPTWCRVAQTYQMQNDEMNRMVLKTHFWQKVQLT
jgi:hypothetical protein